MPYTRVLEALIFPPGGNLLLIIIGLGLLRARHTLGVTLILLSAGTLYLCATPAVSVALLQSLQTYPALTTAAARDSHAQAIVVLGAGRYADAPEYGGDTVSRLGLERLRYAIHVARETGLPLAISGGDISGRGAPEAALMQAAARADFQYTVRWREDRSRTTAENAAYTTALLHSQGVERVLLVTHAWHMPRAARAFRQAGMTVIPAPTGFVSLGENERGLTAWLPNAHALLNAYFTFHELTGALWYRVAPVTPSRVDAPHPP